VSRSYTAPSGEPLSGSGRALSVYGVVDRMASSPARVLDASTRSNLGQYQHMSRQESGFLSPGGVSRQVSSIGSLEMPRVLNGSASMGSLEVPGFPSMAPTRVLIKGEENGTQGLAPVVPAIVTATPVGPRLAEPLSLQMSNASSTTATPIKVHSNFSFDCSKVPHLDEFYVGTPAKPEPFVGRLEPKEPFKWAHLPSGAEDLPPEAVIQTTQSRGVLQYVPPE